MSLPRTSARTCSDVPEPSHSFGTPSGFLSALRSWPSLSPSTRRGSFRERSPDVFSLYMFLVPDEYGFPVDDSANKNGTTSTAVEPPPNSHFLQKPRVSEQVLTMPIPAEGSNLKVKQAVFAIGWLNVGIFERSSPRST